MERQTTEYRKAERIEGLRSDSSPGPLLKDHSEILKNELLIRQAILHIICDSHPLSCTWLRSLTPGQWRRLLSWLDLSGLALYFFDRIAKSRCAGDLPDEVFSSLERRLNENAQRTRSMIAESIAIQRECQRAGLCYAVVKGLSLWPNSVPNPELRLQFDLDYLLADEDMREAQDILIRLGYRPRASSESCWKFVRNERPCLTLKDVYKDTGSWAVELHDVPGGFAQTSQFMNMQWREIFGLSMPTLSPVDVFLRQGLHAYKDVCSQFIRVALLVEFYRHVLFYRDNTAFWTALHREANEKSREVLALGVVTLLTTQVIREFAPEALTHWTVDRLPRPARLWVTMYGKRAVLGSFPGSKLYRLLTRELETGKIHTGLFSLRPSAASCAAPPMKLNRPKETLRVRLIRFVRLIPYRMQLDLIPSRLRFYGVEGLRLAWEENRWRRLLRQASR
ncbi:MAG: nucleotidyltransferase family protein [Terracidiphilus sp.]